MALNTTAGSYEYSRASKPKVGSVFARSAQDSLSRHALDIVAKGSLLQTTKKTQEEAAGEKTTKA
ncbi:hypothetical protein NEUTE2DRAFT_74550 [Neurospora tetrasperma FGSC 2509]|nr:hypothetical protein NEUTE2DRAFT_74550 [Neurospora tetrasperma FGSC 2509]